MSSISWRKFEIIVKLDPDKMLSNSALDILKSVGVDAVIIGGTQNITMENSLNLLRLLQKSGYEGPIFQEITEQDAILLEVEGYLLPVVLNTADSKWFKDAHLEAIKVYGEFIPWERVIPVAYLVCNGDAAVAKKTKSEEPTIEDALAYLTLAEEIFNFPLFYIEYSGKYGDINLISELASRKEAIQIIYGGGINNVSKALEVFKLVETIVIGNLMYETPEKLPEIVEALKDSKIDKG